MALERTAAGHIPPSAVRDYAQFYGVPVSALSRIIDRMELALLERRKSGPVRH